jgi:acyl dehydratase
VTREEVIEFATRYDPQPYRLDDAAAAANPLLGRLGASGVHTMAMSHAIQGGGAEH